MYSLSNNHNKTEISLFMDKGICTENSCGFCRDNSYKPPHCDFLDQPSLYVMIRLKRSFFKSIHSSFPLVSLWNVQTTKRRGTLAPLVIHCICFVPGRCTLSYRAAILSSWAFKRIRVKGKQTQQKGSLVSKMQARRAPLLQAVWPESDSWFYWIWQTAFEPVVR